MITAKNFMVQQEAADRMWPIFKERHKQILRDQHIGHDYTETVVIVDSYYKLECRTCNLEIIIEE